MKLRSAILAFSMLFTMCLVTQVHAGNILSSGKGQKVQQEPKQFSALTRYALIIYGPLDRSYRKEIRNFADRATWYPKSGMLIILGKDIGEVPFLFKGENYRISTDPNAYRVKQLWENFELKEIWDKDCKSNCSTNDGVTSLIFEKIDRKFNAKHVNNE